MMWCRARMSSPRSSNHPTLVEFFLTEKGRNQALLHGIRVEGHVARLDAHTVEPGAHPRIPLEGKSSLVGYMRVAVERDVRDGVLDADAEWSR